MNNSDNDSQQHPNRPLFQSTASHPPPLVPIGESSEDSAYDESQIVPPPKYQRGFKRKRVSWNKEYTREYALVVGDHPLCQDGLPVSLDWQYSDSSPNSLAAAAAPAPARESKYNYPKRLSYEERRKRICHVSGLTEDQVKNDEIDLVVRTLKESWETGALGTVMGDEVQPVSRLSGRMEPAPIQDVDPTAITSPTNSMVVWDDMIMMNADLGVPVTGDVGDVTDFDWVD